MIRFSSALADRGCRLAGLPFHRPAAWERRDAFAPEASRSSPSQVSGAHHLTDDGGDLFDLPDWARTGESRFGEVRA